MKRIFFNPGAADGGGAPDATATVIKAIDAKLFGTVKTDDMTKAISDATANLAKSEDLLAIQKTVNELNEKAGQFDASRKKAKGTLDQISDAIGDKLKGNVMESVNVPFTKTVGTMTAADDLTGSTVLTYRPGVEANPNRRIHFRDLAQIIPSGTGTYSWYIERAKEGAIAFQSSHGVKKSLINARFEQKSVTAEYLAGLAPVAKQMMQDLPFLRGFMPQFMVSEYLKQEDTEFYADLIAVASGDDEIPGAITSNVEKIMGWVTNLRAADYEPNGVVMNPVDVFSIFINKGATSGDYTLPPGVVVANNGGISIYGLPVYQTTFIPVGKALVGDWNRVGIVQVDGLAVLTDDRGDNFDNNTVTFKAEARVALAVLRTDAFIYGDLLVSA
jgi:HK97 family phage major capsid protein